jgi:hypothetical protein
MKAVIADTSPLNYLILIGEVEVLAQLYGEVLIPDVVLAELTDSEAPASARCRLRRASKAGSLCKRKRANAALKACSTHQSRGLILMLKSTAFTECVSAPTEMKLTPVSA